MPRARDAAEQRQQRLGDKAHVWTHARIIGTRTSNPIDQVDAPRLEQAVFQQPAS
jgi:hypothetical protein